jgi:hypothetical protein
MIVHMVIGGLAHAMPTPRTFQLQLRSGPFVCNDLPQVHFHVQVRKNAFTTWANLQKTAAKFI